MATEGRRKTSSTTVFVFVLVSIVALLALAWMFRPPLKKKGSPQPAAAAAPR